MDLRIEIAGDRAVCKQDGKEAFSVGLQEFLKAVVEQADYLSLPDAIPEGVCFIRRRRGVVVLVIEEKPLVRTVRWLADDSPAPFGPGAVYRPARLAFPFGIVMVALHHGALTNFQQCFYRTSPLRSLSDPLFLPNLLNVADTPAQKCWLCLVNMHKDLTALTWPQRVAEIRKHFWGAGFNRSSEAHEGNSYWQRSAVDPRVATVAAWERESQRDPFFPLHLPWRPAGKTVGQAIEEMMRAVCPNPRPTVAAELVPLLVPAGNPAARRLWLAAKASGK